MAVINSPFESQYGFKGPGFSVDGFGNIIANSISTSTTESDDPEFANFNVADIENQFVFTQFSGATNPTIVLERQQTYSFALDTPDLTFSIVTTNDAFTTELYSQGLTHSDGTNGNESQNKTDGTLRFTVPINAPNTLYYTDTLRNNFGIINIIDPVGLFSSVTIKETAPSTSSSTGALTVAGGVGIAGDLYVAGSFNIDGVGVTSITSPTNLELEAVNNIVVSIDGNKIGVIDPNGLNIPVVDTSINNTTIGLTTPAEAKFTSASIDSLPINESSVTNKQYVDSTALSLSIAFGL